jgi:hypothetical protein
MRFPVGRSTDRLPLLILIAGAACSATFLSFVRGPVFYSGDGGMKLLMTQQFAKGVFTSELRLPAEDWVKGLWASGYYPLEPPFVFEVNDRHVVGQPLTFPAASAPFYALFGYRGLYVLPAASFLLLAAAMHVGGRRLGLSPEAMAVAHAGWVTSYLVLYSSCPRELFEPRHLWSVAGRGRASGTQRLVSTGMLGARGDRDCYLDAGGGDARHA